MWSRGSCPRSSRRWPLRPCRRSARRGRRCWATGVRSSCASRRAEDGRYLRWSAVRPRAARRPDRRGVWILVFVLTRYASVSSIVAAASLPVAALLLDEPWPVLVFSSAAALGVLLLHRGNLARLRAGTETRVQLRRKPAATDLVPGSLRARQPRPPPITLCYLVGFALSHSLRSVWCSSGPPLSSSRRSSPTVP